jgi:hypothetical protein
VHPPILPWLSLPKLAALFEPSTPQNFFKGSKVPELEELALTETQLLEQTAALLGVSLAQLVRAGALVLRLPSPGKARYQGPHRLPNLLALAQNPSPRVARP